MDTYKTNSSFHELNFKVTKKGSNMNFKLTKIAAATALTSILLAGCGSDSSSGGSSIIEDVFSDGLSASEIANLEANCVSADSIAIIEAAIAAADTTQIAVDVLIEEAIAAVGTCDVEKYVVLTDESTTQNAQLVYTLPAAQATGKLTAKIKVDSSDPKLSYVTLFSTSSVNTSPLDLKIGGSHEDAYGVEAPADTSIIYSRGKISGDILTDLTLDTLTWVNISLEWDGSNVDVIISDLDGVELSSDTLAYQDGITDAVTKIAFQVSDSSNVTVTDEPIAVDDVMIYDTDLTTLVHSDDFSSGDLSAYSSRGADVITEGEVIVYITELTAEQEAALIAAGVTDTSGIIVGDMTQEEVDAAVAAAIAAATADPDANLVARIIDTTLDADGELRMAVDELATGSVSATIQLQADADTAMPSVDNVDGINNTAYVNVYAGSASSNNLIGEISFTSGGVAKYRDTDKNQQDIVGLTYAEDTPLDFKITWDATGYLVSLDGGVTDFGPFVGIATGGSATTVQFRIGSSSKQATNEMLVDNIVIAGADDVSVLSEDFETDFLDGDELGETYSSSAEATITTIDL